MQVNKRGKLSYLHRELNAEPTTYSIMTSTQTTHHHAYRWGHQSLQDFGVCCMRQMVSHLGPGPSHNGPNSGAQPTPNYMATLKHRPQGLQDTPLTETPGYDSTDAEQDMDASEPICTGWTYVMLQIAPVGPQSKLLIILSTAAPSTSALVFRRCLPWTVKH